MGGSSQNKKPIETKYFNRLLVFLQSLFEMTCSAATFLRIST